MNIINTLTTKAKLLITSVPSRKYYRFLPIFHVQMLRRNYLGAIIFSACFGFWEIISREGGISGVIEKSIRDESLIQVKERWGESFRLNRSQAILQGGEILSEDTTVLKEFDGGKVCFTVEELSPKEISTSDKRRSPSILQRCSPP